MKTNPTQPLRHLLDRAQKRFIRSRPGSVLILVVALLVMMALIGTAYMTMAQFDRGTAIVHSFNTEVDLLLDSVINQAKGTVTGDVFTGAAFRPGVNVTVTGNTLTPVPYDTEFNSAAPRYWNSLGFDDGFVTAYNSNPTNYAHPMQAGDWWLASRVPNLPVDTTPPNATTNPPLWQFITGPVNGAGAFDTPLWLPGMVTRYSQRTQLFPTYTGGFTGTQVMVDGRVWPAWGTPGSAKWVMAADADGDGIADSGLVKLLTLDGVTYYAAVRIVDNAGAINPSIALTPNPFTSYTPAAQMPGDLSPVNLDLEGMTVNPPPTGSTHPTYSSWSAPTDLYGIAGAGGFPGLSPSGPGLIYNFRFNSHVPVPSANPSYTSPVDETGAQRTDFRYMPYQISYAGTNALTAYYYFDQQWMQLGRRLQNPGRLVLNPPNPNAPNSFFQALPVSDSFAMTRNFVLRDPTITSPASSSSILEKMMPNTTFKSPYTGASITLPSGNVPYEYPTTPYQPGDTLKWFAQNFYYWYDFVPGIRSGSYPPNPPSLAPTMPMRALLAPQNPVSNFAPAKFNTNPTAPYQFGDVYTDASTGYKFVCINPGTSTPPLLPDKYWQDPNWAWEPWTNAPTKTSVNTGTFQQLYAAYWAVMADQYTPPLSGAPGHWAPPFPAPVVQGSPPPAGAERRMFRNPCRSWYPAAPATPDLSTGMSPTQVMYLRSALAAINTMQLRSGSQANLSANGTNDVLSRTIYIPRDQTIDGTYPPYQVNVYGVDKQPYLTHIFARNDSDASNNFVAIELYNPYPNAINIGGWKLAVVDRTTKGDLSLQGLDGTPNGQTLSQMVTSPKPLTSIAPHDFVVLVSSLQPPSTIQFTGNEPGPNWYECTALANTFEKELVLMRPRQASGTALPASSAQNNLYDETTPPTAAKLTGLYDWIPVDSYDFSNFKKLAQSKPPKPQQWEYLRPDQPPDKDWHFVYPGPWQVAGTGTAGPPDPNGVPTWSATVDTVSAPPQANVPLMGAGNATVLQNGGAQYQDVAIQVNNTDFGGANKPGTAGNDLPLGAFARNGDILQTTFIGAYKVVDISTPSAPKLVELNTISSDSAMATARGSSETPRYQPLASGTLAAENIGRFCPIDAEDASAAGAAGIDDFSTAYTNQTPPGTTMPLPSWRYHWATRLFDFLTVQAPQDDYFPNVDPWMSDPNYLATYRYAPANTNPAAVPQAVANVTANAANAGLVPPTAAPAGTGASEDTAPVQGLVNINTAPWRVLAAVPWYPASAYPDFRVRNAAIATAITRYRDVDDGTGTGKPHGPFHNLFELGEAKVVPAAPGAPPGTTADKLRNIFGNVAGSAAPNQAQGNLAPLTGTADVKGDFQTQFNEITRLSNLITTRSDSFTAYILIQGWRNAETQTPSLVVQRRAAVIIDRSNVTPTNRSPNAVNVPMN